MTNKFNCILLLDDDPSVNFYHRILIDDLKLTDELLIAEMADDAIFLLEKRLKEKRSFPDLIVLDLNMPRKSGWDFISYLKKRKFPEIFPIKLAIVTASENPDDKNKAENISEVTAYYVKPLGEEEFMELLNMP